MGKLILAYQTTRDDDPKIMRMYIECTHYADPPKDQGLGYRTVLCRDDVPK